MENPDATVVTGRCEVFVGGIKCDAFDLTGMLRYRLELFEGMAGPDDDLRVKTYSDEDRGVTRPSKVLNIVVVSDESSMYSPILYWWSFIRSCVPDQPCIFPPQLFISRTERAVCRRTRVEPVDAC